jgi:hypothetical protein
VAQDQDREDGRQLSPAFPLRLALLSVLGWLLVGSANAAEPPDNVAQAIADAVQSCKDIDGKPNADAVLSTQDLNGDGGEDWIADYKKFKCDGVPNPLCTAGGCTLQIYFWDGETAWDLVFEDLVQSYKFGKNGGNPMMYVTTSGDPCNKPTNETCSYTYRLDKDAVVPVK